MYEFLERLIKMALPRIRDFRGISPKAFDGQGNYTLGVPDQSIFPEVDLDKIKRNVGFDITIVTTAKTNEEAKALLIELGIPFSDKKQPAKALVSGEQLMSNLSDPIADFLARLRNAARAHRGDVSAPYSRMKEEIARILKQEGYISEFEVDTQSKPAQIKVTMKFVNRTPALTGLKRMSKPGLRKYVGSDDIPRVLGGMGVAILSTSRGIITGREARKERVGGELLALVW